jgi:serine/threonine protein kinase
MELCQGKEVIERIIEEGQISENKVAQIIYKVTSAINYCHKIGITHRDIKLSNILINNDRFPITKVKICDLGSSKKLISNIKDEST